MKIKDYTQEELESMTYAEITTLILTEKGTKMKIVDVFKKICTLLKKGESEFENKIADFFELVSTDKNFIVLEKGFCDLRSKHNSTIVIEDDEEPIEAEADLVDTNEPIEEEEAEEDIFYDTSSEDDDIEDDDELDDFVVVDDEEETSL